MFENKHIKSVVSYLLSRLSRMSSGCITTYGIKTHDFINVYYIGKYIADYFNVHNETLGQASEELQRLLPTFHLKQCVSFPTHDMGHRLGLSA